jgi:deoxyribodipyrimidine photo-lyase
MTMIPFPFAATRDAGLSRLAAFTPSTGRHYAANRNTDEGPGLRNGVSMLSPYTRMRMVTEEEILTATLSRYEFATAEKFIQEVFWRAYFKGFLEARPSIWTNYLMDLEAQPRSKLYEQAIAGNMGIDCFDFWVSELRETGYLHNHARMWFASIWIFTLRLPWQLGADFMLQHLIDGDPASNTLSWRWGGGLHTKGKTYLARPDNIATYTNNRFNPSGLAIAAEPLDEPHATPTAAIPFIADQWPSDPFGLLVTTEDLSVPENVAAIKTAIPLTPQPKPGGTEGEIANSFRKKALDDAATRFQTAGHNITRISNLAPAEVLQWCIDNDLKTVAVYAAPIGPEADALHHIEKRLQQNNITLHRVRRRYDSLIWPHCTKGFFALKEKLPSIIQKLNLRGQQSELF